MSSTHAKDNLAAIDELATRLFEAVERRDFNAALSIYAPDAVIWDNVDRKERSPKENLVMVEAGAQVIKDFRYEEIRQTAFPGGFVRQHVARGTTAGGDMVEIAGCYVGEVAGGRITRIDEYWDSAQFPRTVSDAFGLEGTG